MFPATNCTVYGCYDGKYKNLSKVYPKYFVYTDVEASWFKAMFGQLGYHPLVLFTYT